MFARAPKASARAAARPKFARCSFAAACSTAALLAGAQSAAQVAESQPAGLDDSQAATDRPLEEIVVTSEFISQRAISRQRAAPNFRTVIDQSLIERLPDQDLSEALDRVPGVSIQESSSRGFRSQFIVVNGIAPELNNVTILGQEITSTTGDRAIALDLLPSGAASILEVHKSFSPRLEGNFLGGQINIIPLSAFEHDGLHLKASFEGAVFNKEEARDDPAFQPQSFQSPLNAKFEAASTFGPEDRFGIATVFNFFRDSQPVVLRECDSWRFAAGEIPGLPEDLQVCEGMRLENGVRNTRRFSGNAMLEYRPSETTRFFLNALLTNTQEDNVSLQTEWNFFDDLPDADDPEQVRLISPGVLFNPVGENEKELDVDFQEEEFYFFAGGFSTEMGKLTIEGSASYNEADSEEQVREWSFDSANFASTIDFNERAPYGQPVDPEAFFDPASFEFDEIDIEPKFIDTSTTQAQIDFRYDDSFGRINAFFESGLKIRLRESTQDRNERQFDETPGGPLDGATLADFGFNAELGNVFGLPLGPTINAVAGEQFIADNPDAIFFNEAASLDDLVEADFAVDEDVTAGYVMAGIDYGRFQAQFGVRVEHTTVDSIVQNFNDVTNIATPEQASNEFTDAMPSVNARYNILDNLILRASFSQTIARARLSQLAGTREIDFDNDDVLAPGLIRDGSISSGNPDLKPFESDNFDIGIEFYPDNNGAITLSGFYKDISNPIFVRSRTIDNFTAGGFLFEEATVTRPENGGSAELYGMAFAASYQFRQLPGLLGGLGIDGNVSLIESEITDAPGREGETFPLLGQSDLVASITPYYKHGPFELSVVWNFTGDQLVSINDALPSQGVEVAGDGEFDLFQDSRSTLDLRVSYDIMDRVTLFFSAENLTEENRSFFQGRPENEEQVARETATFWFGVRAQY